MFKNLKDDIAREKGHFVAVWASTKRTYMGKEIDFYLTPPAVWKNNGNAYI